MAGRNEGCAVVVRIKDTGRAGVDVDGVAVKHVASAVPVGLVISPTSVDAIIASAGGDVVVAVAGIDLIVATVDRLSKPIYYSVKKFQIINKEEISDIENAR